MTTTSPATRPAIISVRPLSLAVSAVRKVTPSSRASENAQSMIAPREKLSSRPANRMASAGRIVAMRPRLRKTSCSSQMMAGTRNGANTLGSLKKPIARVLS